MTTIHRSAGSALVASAVLAAVIGIWASLPAAAQERRVAGIGLAVFVDPNFRGDSATFRADVPDLRAARLNDEITSVQVGRGEAWEVCEDINFGGRCRVLIGDESDLRRVGWNDKISSVRLVREGPGSRAGRGGAPRDTARLRGPIELFSETGFSGASQVFDNGIPNLLPLGFNDRARSLRLAPSETWEVCEDANYRNCRVINSSVTDLGDVGMSTRISSLRPVGRVGRPGPGFGRERARLVLYDQRNFRGPSILVEQASPNFGRFGATAESIQVEGGIWEVCSGTSFQGRCTIVSTDAADLGRIGLRDNVRSARPVRMASPR
jgi:hypothetical protein